MDRGAWQATAQSHKESDTTEATKHACTHTCRDMGTRYIPDTVFFPMVQEFSNNPRTNPIRICLFSDV